MILIFSSAISENVFAKQEDSEGRESEVDVSSIHKIYIGGMFADDDNDGSTGVKAVKSFARAKELLPNGGTAIVNGEISVEDIQTWYSDEGKMIALKRSPGYAGQIFKVYDNGNLTIRNLIIDGGAKDGIFGEASLTIVDNGGILNIQDGALIRNNNTISKGAGVECYGTLDMSGGAIYGNSGQRNGAGLYLYSGKFTMTGGSIYNNKSEYEGGAIFAEDSEIKFYGGEITLNTAQFSAGVISDNDVQIQGDVIIRGNKLLSNKENNLKAKLKISAKMGNRADIGISANRDEVFAQGTGGYLITDADSNKFKSDDSELEVTFVDGNKLALSPKSSAAFQENVYLNGISGDDNNLGNSVDAPVKTFEKAKSVLARDGTIFIMEKVLVESIVSWDLSGKGNAKIQRHPDYKDGPLVELDGEMARLHLTSIVLDGNAEHVISTEGLVNVKLGNLVLGEESILQNQKTSGSGAAIHVFEDGSMSLKGGVIQKNHSLKEGGGIYNSGNILLESGKVIQNSAGKKGGGILNCGYIILKNDIIVKENKVSAAGIETPSNLFMEKGKEAVLSAALSEEADICIFSEVQPANLVRGFTHPNPAHASQNYQITQEDFEKFHLDDEEECKLQFSENLISIRPKLHNPDGIYLNPLSGEDEKNGKSSENAVKSISRAIALAQENSFDKIYLMSKIVINDEQSLDFNHLQLIRYIDYTDEMINVAVRGKLSLSNVLLDGGALMGIKSDAALIRVEGDIYENTQKGELKLSSGAILQNNVSNLGGGAIQNLGIVQMYDGSVIRNCESKEVLQGGGGIFNAPGASLSLFGGIIEKNKAFWGGGIENRGTLIIRNTHIRKNTSGGFGGGIHMMASPIIPSLLMEGGKISNNESLTHSGGGIFAAQGEITLKGGIITENIAPENAGVCVSGRKVSVKIGGNIQIAGNLTKDGKSCNLVHDQTDAEGIFAIAQFEDLGDLARIGVYGKGMLVTAAAGYEIRDLDVKKYSSDLNFRVYKKNNAVYMDDSTESGSGGNSNPSTPPTPSTPSTPSTPFTPSDGGDSGSFVNPNSSPVKKDEKKSQDSKNQKDAVLQNQANQETNLDRKIQALAIPQNNLTVFKDVEDKNWYTGAVNYVYEKGIMNGVSEDNFSPNTVCTRNMFISMIHRMADSPKVEADIKFKDIEAGSYYEDAIKWGVTNHIISGYNESTFGTNDVISREQVAVILMNFAISQGVDVSSNIDMSKFEDFNQSSDYAKKALIWAHSMGIINGTSKNTLDPKSGATRAQIAIMIQRYMILVQK